MATMATNHVSVATGQVATTSLPRYRHYVFSNYIIPSHYGLVLFFSVYQRFCSEYFESKDREHLGQSLKFKD